MSTRTSARRIAILALLLGVSGTIGSLVPGSEPRGGKAPALAQEAVGYTLTTLFGRALLRPTCPVERQPDGACDPRPLPDAEIALQSEDGSQTIVTLRTNEQGFFGLGFVTLPPGRYRLHPLAPQPGLPPHPPSDLIVEIKEGQLTYVEMVYDSGVR